MTKDRNYFVIALLVSLMIHLVLVFSAALIKFSEHEQLAEYTEVDLVSETAPEIVKSAPPAASGVPAIVKATPVKPVAQAQPQASVVPLATKNPEKPVSEIKPELAPFPVPPERVAPAVVKEEAKPIVPPKPVVNTTITTNSSPVVQAAINLLAGLAGTPQGAGEVQSDHSGVGADTGPGLIEGPVAKRGVRSKQEPRYPETARRKGIEDDVDLLFWVDPEGNVISVEPETKSGYFDDSAMQALRSWKFAPLDSRLPRKDQWGKVTMRFRLEH